MDRRLRARLAFNGLMIFVLGLVIAIPFAIIFSKGNGQNTNLWSVAHLEALVHGLLLMGLADVQGHHPVEPMNRCRCQGVKAFEGQEPILGVESRGDLGGTFDVCKEHGDEFAFTGAVTVCNDLVDDAMWSLLGVDRRRHGDCPL
jgi:hypothetical protein